VHFRLGGRGKLRHGFNFKIMNETSAALKLALIYCKQNEDMVFKGKLLH
jgi:hypothetical protein